MMQRDHARPIRPHLEQRAIPDLGLRSRVGEDDRALTFLDRAHDGGQHLRAEMARPREPLDHRRDQRIHHDTLRLHAAHDAAGPSVGAQQRHASIVEIADGRRQPPDPNVRLQLSQSREHELHLHATLGSHELVPLVDDDEVHAVELLGRILARQEQ
jgi:hypothetical protein